VNVFFRYLENRGEGAVVRPWVWIAYLFLGPALGTICFQWYIYITVSTRLNIGVLLITCTLFFSSYPPDRFPSARLGYHHAARL
jgi:hypothetical protein